MSSLIIMAPKHWSNFRVFCGYWPCIAPAAYAIMVIVWPFVSNMILAIYTAAICVSHMTELQSELRLAESKSAHWADDTGNQWPCSGGLLRHTGLSMFKRVHMCTTFLNIMLCWWWKNVHHLMTTRQCCMKKMISININLLHHREDEWCYWQ